MVEISRTCDIDGVMALAREMPDYFTQKGLKQMREDCADSVLLAAREEGVLVGFAVLEQRGDIVELAWLGVKSRWRRRGIGTALVQAVLKQITQAKTCTVRTLAEESDYAPYAGTRAFFLRAGFVPVGTSRPSDWDDPCLTLSQPIGVH